MKERYKPIPKYEGRYGISNLGSVISIRPPLKGNKYYIPKKRSNILKPDIRKGGYCMVTLYDNGHSERFYIHRLVATVFVKNPNNYPVVNHIDNNPSNNNYKNLEWCTIQQNCQHCIKSGRKVLFFGENNSQTKLTQVEVDIIRDMVNKKGLRQNVVANIFNVSFQHVSKICNGTRRKIRQNL